MSPELLTSRRLYARIRRDIECGRFPPGSSLPLAELAYDLGTSVQPVRDVLARLAGERVLALHPRAGFQLPEPSRQAMRDLVDWHAHLLRLILRERRSDQAMPNFVERLTGLEYAAPGDVADAATSLFSAIADGSDNVEHVEAIRSANTRLHVLWLRDSESSMAVHELQMIASATFGGSQSAIKAAIWAYQRRQQRRVRRLFQD